LHPARFIAVFCVNAEGERGPAVTIAIYDLDSSGTRLADAGDVISALSQVDFDPQPGVVSGRISWSVTPEVDTAYVSHYIVYMAEDEARTGLQVLGQVPVGTNELGFDELVFGEWRYWFVHWRDADDISEAHAGPLEIRDMTTTEHVRPVLASAAWDQVSDLTFVDDDVRRGWVGSPDGITWTAPANRTWVDRFEVFMLNSPNDLSEHPSGEQRQDITLLLGALFKNHIQMAKKETITKIIKKE
jgi:hypothetical protein